MSCSPGGGARPGGRTRCPDLLLLVKEVGLALGEPCLFLRPHQRVEVARRGGRVVDPLPQALAAVDDVDGEALLVFVREVAPKRVAWAERAQRLEGECHKTPGKKRAVVVARPFYVDLHACA